MTTLPSGQIIPDGVALRLAGHYATSANDALALLRWTGAVLPGTSQLCRRLTVEQYAGPDHDSCGRRDPHAIVAELRALSHYCEVHGGRQEVEGWRDWTPASAIAAKAVVPWGWQPPTEEGDVR